MAASGLEREDSLLEAHRTSLLEVIEDKNRAASKVPFSFNRSMSYIRKM